MESQKFKNEIKSIQEALVEHPLYLQLNTLENLRVFMKYHSFAVWDFMSLLKSLQNKLTCTSLPWKPSKVDSQIVQVINEIVLGEESDMDSKGNPLSHFELYLKAMDEVGADKSELLEFIDSLDLSSLPKPLSRFISFNLETAISAPVEVVASVFFYGREKIIPSMFTPALENVQKSLPNEASELKFYFARHIEVDGDSHGPMASQILDHLCGNDISKWQSCLAAARTSLQLRKELWDFILEKIS